MGSLAFKWILSNANLPSSIGSAYTSLVTALKGTSSHTELVNVSQEQRKQSIRESRPRSPYDIASQHASELAQLPPLPDWHGTALEASEFQQHTKAIYTAPPSPLASLIETLPSTASLTKRQRHVNSETPKPRMALPPSPGSQKRSVTSMVREVDNSSGDLRRGTLSSTESQATAETMLQLEVMLKSY